MPADARRSVGARGERLAEAHLRRAGYRVLARNFRSRSGELDLVVAGSGCIVFCEVRSRVGTARRAPGEAGGPLESIGPAKRRRLRRLAAEWLAAPEGRGARAGAARAADALRFDAIGVILDPEGRAVAIEHVEDAF